MNLQSILASHYQSSAARAARESVVLAVQDTTSLSHRTHLTTELLGPIGSDADGAVGMLVHITLAFNQAGMPFGLLQARC